MPTPSTLYAGFVDNVARDITLTALDDVESKGLEATTVVVRVKTLAYELHTIKLIRFLPFYVQSFDVKIFCCHFTRDGVVDS
ncbi:uncharacterized protein BT62DRAFT_1008958 [Guyanagaster necrorhizus]|uniref:Uncharacterized protein n=1 Tax=Guyanagaster necrorhizus TaxID=856835 RepID=A0A9P8AQ34_9AGAR|nr:uncharacterized protein BT62DRAFT_1008958 [Guyanagaster necrorhizus MCA 3950]KAG7443600.1 hypothetical protein BT62DRAFT_1008958 [Guyanagaster necrorhizus MCA 3950]